MVGEINPMKLRIKGDGGVNSTTVQCVETGAAIEHVTDITIIDNLGCAPRAKIELVLTEFDVIAEGEFTAILADGHRYRLTRIDEDFPRADAVEPRKRIDIRKPKML
jgi:hypothetical protein